MKFLKEICFLNIMLALCLAFLARAVLAGDPQVSSYRWSDANLPLRYRLNVTRVPAQMHSTFILYGRIGLDDWAKVEGSRLTSCYRGTTASFQKTGEHILAVWDDLPAGIGGYAYYPPVGLITYNARYAAQYYRDHDNLRNLTLHENGHAIGFPHYFEDESVMAYKFIPYLTEFDRRLIRLNYPGDKITSEACCAKTDTPLATARAFPSKSKSTPAHEWCYASWMDRPASEPPALGAAERLIRPASETPAPGAAERLIRPGDFEPGARHEK